MPVKSELLQKLCRRNSIMEPFFSLHVCLFLFCFHYFLFLFIGVGAAKRHNVMRNHGWDCSLVTYRDLAIWTTLQNWILRTRMLVWDVEFEAIAQWKSIHRTPFFSEQTVADLTAWCTVLIEGQFGSWQHIRRRVCCSSRQRSCVWRLNGKYR
jgi:hypothetical protein